MKIWFFAHIHEWLLARANANNWSIPSTVVRIVGVVVDYKSGNITADQLLTALNKI